MFVNTAIFKHFYSRDHEMTSLSLNSTDMYKAVFMIIEGKGRGRIRPKRLIMNFQKDCRIELYAINFDSSPHSEGLWKGNFLQIW